MRYVRALAMLLAGLLVNCLPPLTLACECLPKPPPQDHYDEVAAVFTGVVTAIHEVDLLGPMYAVEFRTTGAWKGVSSSQSRVLTDRSSAGCGKDFLLGTEYLVYAWRVEGVEGEPLYTTSCSRTRGIIAAAEDLETLGDPGPVPVSWGDLRNLYRENRPN